ncbi:restriction endonuclease type II-like protein [Phlebopus sp. FC_14]|nr:restriction endonuclease type II-like protein [Phlebopus sp. FC_14]
MLACRMASSSASTIRAKPPVVQPGGGNNIVINPNQRLNPVLQCIRNVGKEFGDIVPDFQVGRTTCILFLSLRYHRLHPEYIHTRIEKLGRSYNLRILLIMCDVTEHQELIRELTKVCLINNITVIVAWSNDEAGQYIATFKQFEHKPPDLIKERVDKDYDSLLRTALTGINKVNKTDVETLRTSLGSFTDIAKASPDQLQNLPGFGQVKVRRIKDAFEKPFRNNATSATFSLGSQVAIPQATTSEVDEGAQLADLKGKGKEIPTRASTPARSASPAWDIELNLNTRSLTPTNIPNTAKFITTDPERRSRERSPVWDIELDLNDLDEDTAPGGKELAASTQSPFGTTRELL